ncbi:hypothetical protein ACFYYR_03650 [Streptomyces sp. NPDC001922]|uniref:hypothetical protein n=1 Tax=Streptomyces sp. NPDC001922 TaxID=3364624 RepID=UPI0036CBF643
MVSMVPRTPAEESLARSYSDGRYQFDVSDLLVEHHLNRQVTLTYLLTVRSSGRPAEDWEFTMLWDDKSFVDLFTSSAPDPERLKMLVHIVRAHIEEWWYTKGGNQKSAKMGRRLS